MKVEKLLEDWTAHYLGGMGFRLHGVVPEGEGAYFTLGWRGAEMVKVLYVPMEEERGARLVVDYRPGSLPRGVEEGLFKVLGVLVPPRGRIALKVEVRELEEHLRRGIPLVLTPWGLLVWLAGARDLSWTEDALEGYKPLKERVDLQELDALREFARVHSESRDPYIMEALERWETMEWEMEDQAGAEDEIR